LDSGFEILLRIFGTFEIGNCFDVAFGIFGLVDNHAVWGSLVPEFALFGVFAEDTIVLFL
jgi:hypothetical protein